LLAKREFVVRLFPVAEANRAARRMDENSAFSDNPAGGGLRREKFLFESDRNPLKSLDSKK
jgi:hypothetical protein